MPRTTHHVASASGAAPSTTATGKLPFESVFEMKRELSTAIYGRVVKAVERDTGDVVAVKIADRVNASRHLGGPLGTVPVAEDIPNEIDILSKLARRPHPNCTQLHASTDRIEDDRRRLFVCVAFANQGDLFSVLRDRGALGEHLTRRLFTQACRAVSHLHNALGYSHRDISLENFVVHRDETSGEFELKLADFGLAARMTSELFSTGAVRPGKPSYIAPEVWNYESYDGRKVDVYALGVVLFSMLARAVPYQRPDERVDGAYRMIKAGRVRELVAHWSLGHLFPDGALSLIERMLSTAAADRPSLDEVLSDSWLRAAEFPLAEVEAEAEEEVAEGAGAGAGEAPEEEAAAAVETAAVATVAEDAAEEVEAEAEADAVLASATEPVESADAAGAGAGVDLELELEAEEVGAGAGSTEPAADMEADAQVTEGDVTVELDLEAEDAPMSAAASRVLRRADSDVTVTIGELDISALNQSVELAEAPGPCDGLMSASPGPPSRTVSSTSSVVSTCDLGNNDCRQVSVDTVLMETQNGPQLTEA